MISLKKYLADNETEQALMRVIQILLQGVVLHAVTGHPDDYTRFRQGIDLVHHRFDEDISNAERVAQAGAALRSIEEYNRRTAAYLRLPGLELQAMVRMLTETVTAISAAGDENVRRLREIEIQVESASQIEDVRTVKVKLGECLGEIRRETERQRIETSKTVQRLTQGLESTQKASTARLALPAIDPVTGLPTRQPAEDTLAKACQDGAPAFAVAVQIDRIQIFNARFGYEVGDEILRYFAGFLRQQLPAADLLFRWTGPTIVALLFRPNRLERVRDEVGRIMESKYEHTVETASRTVLLPISVRWALFPLMASPLLLSQKIDSFAAYQGARD